MSQGSAPTLGAAHLRLRDQVRDDIRDRIIAGTLKPGDRIVERELATELGVSRIPVREAIRMLESEGFVTVVPRRGVVVKSMSAHDVLELFDVREALEVLAVRRAAERAGKTEDPEALCQQHQRLLDAISSGDPERAAAEALVHVQTNRETALRLLFGTADPEAADAKQPGDRAG